MRMLPGALRGLSLGAIGLLLLLWCWSRGSSGEQAQAAQEKKESKLTKFYFGVDSCRLCHTQPQKGQNPQLCRCNEVALWEAEDKHADAWNVLLSERAQRMGKLLGWEEVDLPIEDLKTGMKETRRVSSVATRAECVNCHGLHVDNPDYVKDSTFKKEEGVNCCVCHGTYKEWVSAHFNPVFQGNKQWRDIKDRAAKERDYGMKDLWNPVKRSQLCLSCHVGNTEEGKFVTHAMYAAGHPPLPSVEIATFSEEMPRHWQYPIEKSEAVQKLQDFDAVQAKFERTQLVLLGGVAALGESLNLVATQAERAATAKEEDDRSLDFALFDCYACHHELKTPAWRQGRGYKGKPGRPQLQVWPTSLVHASLRSLGRDEKQLDTALAPLFKVFDSRPFGDPVRAAEEARKAKKWADELAGELRKRPLDQATVDQILQILASLQGNEYPDYDSARQLAWGYLMIFSEVRGQKYSDIKKASEPLDKVLKLSLPATRGNQLEKDLPLALEKRGEYDPAVFKREFRNLIQRLGEK